MKTNLVLSGKCISLMWFPNSVIVVTTCDLPIQRFVLIHSSSKAPDKCNIFDFNWTSQFPLVKPMQSKDQSKSWFYAISCDVLFLILNVCKSQNHCTSTYTSNEYGRQFIRAGKKIQQINVVGICSQANTLALPRRAGRLLPWRRAMCHRRRWCQGPFNTRDGGTNWSNWKPHWIKSGRMHGFFLLRKQYLQKNFGQFFIKWNQ